MFSPNERVESAATYRTHGGGAMDETELSRRQILATLGAAGLSGAALGTGTGAILTDGSRLTETTLAAGSLDLRVAWNDGATGSATRTSIDLSGGDRTGTERITLTLPPDGNPAAIWVGTTCLDDELGDHLDVTLSYADPETGERLATLATGSTFDQFADDLGAGVALDGTYGTDSVSESCFAAGSSLSLALSWSLSEAYRGTPDDGFVLQFRARQCRNAADAPDPFASESGGCSS